MRYGIIVKDGSTPLTASYDGGKLTGDEFVVTVLLDEIKFQQEEGRALVPYDYVPQGKYLDDPLAVKLIAEIVFDNVEFAGDVPEIEPDSGEEE